MEKKQSTNKEPNFNTKTELQEGGLGTEQMSINALQILDLSAIQQQSQEKSKDQGQCQNGSKIKNNKIFKHQNNQSDESIDVRDIQFPQFFAQEFTSNPLVKNNKMDFNEQQNTFKNQFLYPFQGEKQKRQLEDEQDQDFCNDQPLKGSFLREMQQLGKTISFQSRMYNIYHSSFLESSADKSRKGKNDGFQANHLNQSAKDEDRSSHQVSTQFLELRKKISELISIQLSGNFKMVQNKYVIDFDRNFKQKKKKGSLNNRNSANKGIKYKLSKESSRFESYSSDFFLQPSQTISMQSKYSKPTNKITNSKLSQPFHQNFDRKVTSKSTFFSKTSTSKNRTINSQLDHQTVMKPMKKHSVKKIAVNRAQNLKKQQKKGEAEKKVLGYGAKNLQKTSFAKKILKKTEKQEPVSSIINQKFKSLASMGSQAKISQQKGGELSSIDALYFDGSLNQKIGKNTNYYDTPKGQNKITKVKRRSTNKIKNK